MIMRVNSAAHQEKRAAALAVFLGIRYDATAFSVALKFALSHNVPVSTLTIVLQLVELYEQSPYEVTSGAIAELQAAASMPYVTARVLARSLLERAGLVVAMPTSSEPGAAAHFRRASDRDRTRSRPSATFRKQLKYGPISCRCLELVSKRRAPPMRRKLKWSARSGDLVRSEKDDVWPCGLPSMSRSSVAFRPLAPACERLLPNMEFLTPRWKGS